MKKLFTILIFAILFGGSAMAYDFSAICESGQTLYYNITSNTVPYTVEVTYESGYGAYNTFPTGDLTISETVEYNSITYSVTSIGNVAFYGCSGLTSLTIGNSVTSIEMGAFWDCSGLTSVTIGNSVTSIVGFAFKNCRGLTSVTIGNSVTSIGAEAFSGCSGLTSITIPNSVTSIGYSAFEGCSGLTTVTIPNSVTSIRSGAFEDCSGLTSVTIPNSVTSIYPYTFQNCSGLTSITIPEYVDTIGASAFGGCSNLEVVNFNATNCKIMGNYYYENGEWSQYVEHYVFRDCTSLTALNIGENVTNIPAYAFCGCNGLTTVTIPSSVTSIGECAFALCSGLTSVTIPNSVTSIDLYAFQFCSGLTSVTIPNSVTSIGEGAFYGCSGLTSVYYTGDLAGWCRIEFGDFDSNPVPYSHNLYINNELVTDLIIPETISEIKAYAFFGASCITSLTIPNSVTSIGNYAFCVCSGLTGNLMIPESVTSIGSYAFNGCSGLTWVNIPNSVTSISDYTFYGCSGLTYVNIPHSLTSFGDYAFYGCSGMTSVRIPESVTSIGNYAFYGCSGLTSVTIGNSVNSIGDYAFYYCWRLEKIYSNAETPATIETNTFSSTVPIFVPCGAENTYLADEQWGRLNINSELPYQVNVSSADEEMGSAVLLHQYCGSSTAVIEARSRYGYHFVHWNDGNTDNPRTITVTEDVIYTATFEVGDGIEENNMESKISLFPNPATDILNITSSETISEIEIVNTLGQVVKRIEVNADNAVCDVEGLKSGVYVVKVSTLSLSKGANVSQRKFIKE